MFADFESPIPLSNPQATKLFFYYYFFLTFFMDTPRLPPSRLRKEETILQEDETSSEGSKISYVAHAIATGRHHESGRLLTSHPISKICHDMYTLCSRLVEVSHLTRANDPSQDARNLRLLAWEKKARYESTRWLEEIIKPKIADVLMFYISSRDYSAEEISTFVEGISDLLVHPPSSAVKHDWANAKRFNTFMEQCKIDSNAREMDLGKAITGKFVDAPCVTIQRCHALFPIQLSSPMNSTTAAGERPVRHQYGDLPSFSSDATRPYFSAVFPLLLSLFRLDEYQHELIVMSRVGMEEQIELSEFDDTNTRSRWMKIKHLAMRFERLWRETALFVDFVDPEVRSLLNLQNKHKAEGGAEPVIKIGIGGLSKLKRPRSKDPLNVPRPPPASGSSESRTKRGPRAEAPHELTASPMCAIGFRYWAEQSHTFVTIQHGGSSSVYGRIRLPRDTLRHIASFLTPRCLSSFAFSSKYILVSLLPLECVDSNNLSMDDLFILRSLQLSRDASRILGQCVQQLWSERFVYMRDPQMHSNSDRARTFSSCISTIIASLLEVRASSIHKL